MFANRGIQLVRNFELTDIMRREIRRLVWVVYKNVGENVGLRHA